MSFNNKVDYMPNQPFASANIDSADTQHAYLQRRKWQVLVGTFLLVLLVTNGIIWSQAQVYQSQAILQFSYSSQPDQELEQLARRHIVLHQRRLTSNSVLGLVAQELEQSQILEVSIEELSKALSVEASPIARAITLIADGHDRQVLKPLLDAWVKVYLDLTVSETKVNNSDELMVAEQQLQLLELKITEQEQRLQLFASENNIISLARDENRILSQTKNLGANLDQALAEKAQAQALLNSLVESIEDGQAMIRPSDKAQIDANKANLQEINNRLSALSQKYTQAYLERDPVIVDQQQRAKQLATQIEQQIQTSQADYLLDVKRDLSTATDKVEQMSEQLVEQNQLAQVFSQNLQQFKRLDDELKALQNRAQALENQRVAQEVSQPFATKISLLEPAFKPEFAVGPDYQLQSLISPVVALISAVLALLVFSFIFKQKTPTAASQFVVIPRRGEGGNYSNLDYVQNEQLAAPDLRLPSETAIAPPAPQNIRLLSLDECQLLYSTANQQGKALVGLILSGINLDELLAINKDNFSQDYSVLMIKNQFSRNISIQPNLAQIMRTICRDLADGQTIWPNITSQEDLVQLLINLGHDAQLAFPEQLSLAVLRHTYLTYLASQGARLNDIEQVAGYTSPKDLALYRHVSRQGKLQDLQQIQTQYPFAVST